MELRNQKISDLLDELSKDGLLTEAQVNQAKSSAKAKSLPLDDLVISMGLMSEKDFSSRLARKLGIANISLESYQPDPKSLKLITTEQAHKWQFIPLFEIEGKLTVATANPLDFNTLDDARQKLNLDIECILSSKNDITNAIKQFYGELPVAKANSQSIDIVHYSAESNGESDDKISDISFLASNTVSIVDQLLQNAFLSRASDIHLEPTREGLKVRLRIDGMLEQLDLIPLSAHAAVLSRIKIIGGMDVAEHRIAQDGRTHIKIKGQELDLRIATYPTIFGEAAAIRLLLKEKLISLEDIGLMSADMVILEKIIHQPHGIFLVTGPTGSGKTSTLYAALQKIDRDKNHVLSVEDPVENEIAGVSQTQINVKAGVTFASALRSALREDPDIILLGEIRDQETAQIAFRAAMTGHLVLSTLHTNSAVGTIARLVDLDIENYLISSTLLGVLAQRLVRRLCQFCKEPTTITPEFAFRTGDKAQAITQAFSAKGCNQCHSRGFQGRIGIFELLAINDEFRVLITTSAHEIRMKEKAAALGFRSMLDDGIDKIKLGLTTQEEVLRVCGEK